jgi:SOS-response transcriptional repressor LexA
MLAKLVDALMLDRDELGLLVARERAMLAGGETFRRELQRIEDRARRSGTGVDLDALLRSGDLHRLAGVHVARDERDGRVSSLAIRLGGGAVGAGRGDEGDGSDGGAGSRGAHAVRQSPRSDDAPLVMLSREIPLINRVAAGYPREFTDLGYPARVADEYVRVPDIADPDAFAARVVGDSMLPQYVEGDVVIFSPARPVVSGMDCFARLERDAESTFKRVYFEDGAGITRPSLDDATNDPDAPSAMIRLQPLNSAYAPRLVPREEVAGLYAAVSVLRKIG